MTAKTRAKTSFASATTTSIVPSTAEVVRIFVETKSWGSRCQTYTSEDEECNGDHLDIGVYRQTIEEAGGQLK